MYEQTEESILVSRRDAKYTNLIKVAAVMINAKTN